MSVLPVWLRPLWMGWWGSATLTTWVWSHCPDSGAGFFPSTQGSGFAQARVPRRGWGKNTFTPLRPSAAVPWASKGSPGELLRQGKSCSSKQVPRAPGSANKLEAWGGRRGGGGSPAPGPRFPWGTRGAVPTRGIPAHLDRTVLILDHFMITSWQHYFTPKGALVCSGTKPLSFAISYLLNAIPTYWFHIIVMIPILWMRKIGGREANWPAPNLPIWGVIYLGFGSRLSDSRSCSHNYRAPGSPAHVDDCYILWHFVLLKALSYIYVSKLTEMGPRLNL